jgi:hypothetical protein
VFRSLLLVSGFNAIPLPVANLDDTSVIDFHEKNVQEGALKKVLTGYLR